MTDLSTQETDEPVWCGWDTRHGPHDQTDFMSVGNGDIDEVYSRCPGHGLVTVSFSEIDTFRQCPKKHDLGYLQRWSGEPSDNSALGRGSLWHRVLEAHYKTIQSAQVTTPTGEIQWDVTGADLMVACEDAVRSLFTVMIEDEQRDPEIITLLRWMYDGHISMWGLDEEWDILAVESTNIVPLYEAGGSESWVRLKIKVDLLVRDHRGRIWVVDHKSCGNLPQGKDFDWADQFGLYTYGMRKLGIKVIGSIHSAARTKMNKGDLIKPGDPGYKSTMVAQTIDQRFGRIPMNYTEAQLEGIAGDALADAKLAHSEHNHKRRNPDEERCKWKCGFAEACMFGRRTGKESNVLDMLQRTGFTQEPMRH